MEWTLFGDDERDLVRRVAALQAANAALEAQLAALEAEMAAVRVELSTMRASEATLRTAADARFADAMKSARPERLGSTSGPGAQERLFHMENHMFYVGLPEDQRVRYAQQFLTGWAFSWCIKARRQQAVWTWEEFAAEMMRKFGLGRGMLD